MNQTKENNFEIVTLTYFKNWHEFAKKYKLTPAQYGEAVYAMCEYCFYGKDTNLAPPHGIIFDMAKASIDKSNERKRLGHYGGSKGRGGAPPGNDNAVKKK